MPIRIRNLLSRHFVVKRKKKIKNNIEMPEVTKVTDRKKNGPIAFDTVRVDSQPCWSMITAREHRWVVIAKRIISHRHRSANAIQNPHLKQQQPIHKQYWLIITIIL